MMKHFGDITKLNGAELPIVDVITGGSPCQDLSVAGRREGLQGKRSGLFMEQIRLIKEMRENDRTVRGSDVDIRLLRPRYMVWENVTGALSSGKNYKGEDFRIVLEEIAKIVCEDAVIPMPENGKWMPSGCILGNGWSIAWRVHDAQFWGVPQRRKRIALVADFNGESAPEILFERKSVSRDIESSEQTRKEVARDIGNGTKKSDKVICEVISSDGNIAGTLDANYYKGTGERRGRERTFILDRTICIGNGQTNDAVQIEEEVCKTLNCLVDPMKILQIQKPVYGVDCYNQSASEEVSKALTNKATDSDYIPCVTYGFELGVDEEKAIVQKQYNTIVRRLTPLECERLQGFPDGWTDIGEWMDSKGKKHKDADSPRYRALGNSIALPYWEWLAGRICKQYDRTVEMASLFDGIGGFPLVFSRHGAIPVWASEIEGFPIAVTKLRFPESEGV